MEGRQQRGDVITSLLASLLLFCWWISASILPMQIHLPALVRVILVGYSQGISIITNHRSPLIRSGVSLSTYLLSPTDRLKLIKADAVRKVSSHMLCKPSPQVYTTKTFSSHVQVYGVMHKHLN